MMRGRRHVFASLCSLIVVLTPLGVSAERHPIWNPGLEQSAHGRLGRGQGPATIEALRESVRPYLGLADRELRRKIGAMAGGARGEAAIRERAQATYNLALLHHLTKSSEQEETDYGHRSALLLTRYAEVFPFWDYKVCKGQCGLWTDWYHADFDTSMNLALAYDLLPRSSFDAIDESSHRDVRKLMVDIVAADLRFRMYTMNWAFFRPLGLVVFGRVLDDPELVHLGYWFLAKHLHEYYTRDGFIAEGTYSYHAQMTDRMLLSKQAFYLDGYSDPDGFVHEPFDDRWDPVRIDDFDLEATHGPALRRMKFSLRETALPDGRWPVLNETVHYDEPRAKPATNSLLLGGIGHGILARGSGSSQTQARLDFSPTLSHRHRDALNLIFFGKGREVIGGTAYRKPDRDWNISTLSHNLVVVDENQQRGNYFVDWTMAPYVPGVGRTMKRVRRQRWDPESENLHNNVLLWEPGYRGFDEVQVLEVDAADAYRGRVDRYQRLLAMVEAGEGGVYLADIFRVRGGTQYDWLLHGGHDPNRLVVNSTMEPAVGRLGELRWKEGLTTAASWQASFEHGGVSGRVLMAGRSETTIFRASGPRYQHGGLQDHLVVRRQTDAQKEEVFLAVHEVVEGEPVVKSIEELRFEGAPGTAVAMRIRLMDGADDYLIHSLDPGPNFPEHKVAGHSIRMRGRFAHIRMRDGELEWMMLNQGAELEVGGDRLVAEGKEFSQRGRIVAVERRESGASENAFIADRVLIGGESFEETTLLVRWANGWSWPYRVERIEGNRIVTSEEPGFEMRGGNVHSQYFPLEEFLGLESFPGPVSFLLSGTAIRDREGRTLKTNATTSTQSVQ
ncbi:MAG: hypothetical protein CL933_12485 [Deltaproteobacteria bacterium]|nr:hypothetical protein [Deltaproteobacteria bacterium]